MTLRLEGLEKTYADGTDAVRGVDLVVEDGELLVLVGPSGSGKSTILRMVAGLERPTGGRIHIGDRDVTGLEPGERDIAMVFQSYALYPHKSVRQNLAFGLRMHRRPAQEIRERVEAVARSLDIEALLDRRPAQLSGGQRQRVALGRAIVREPAVFLLDEPLSNLDPALRHEARLEIARLHRRLGVTIVYVTHDQEEAMTLGDRAVVLREGAIEQVAPPMELYRAPATRFVAGFIGTPPMNFLPCRFEPASGGGARLAGDGVTVRLREMPPALHTGSSVTVGIRPHDVRAVPRNGGADARGTVEVVEPRGSETVVRVRLFRSGGGDGERAGTLTVVLPPDHGFGVGDPIGIGLPPEHIHLFDPDSGTRLA